MLYSSYSFYFEQENTSFKSAANYHCVVAAEVCDPSPLTFASCGERKQKN